MTFCISTTSSADNDDDNATKVSVLDDVAAKITVFTMVTTTGTRLSCLATPSIAVPTLSIFPNFGEQNIASTR